VLHVQAAGFSRRSAAALIDLLVASLFTIGLTGAASWILGLSWPPGRMGPDLLLVALLDGHPLALGCGGLFLGISILYSVFYGGIVGQTFGKRALGLRVISYRGTAPGPLGGLLRMVGVLVSVLPAGAGWLWCLVDRKRRTLHDHLTGTYVIRDESP
jgi:uncharacterized RDD family membrane protein YckC